MRDLTLSTEHDLVIAEFDLQLTDARQLVKQRIKQALLMFKGEWFLNVNLGVPYYQELLGQKNSIGSVRAILMEALKKVEGVQEIIELNLNIHQSNNMMINFTVIDDANNLLKIEL